MENAIRGDQLLLLLDLLQWLQGVPAEELEGKRYRGYFDPPYKDNARGFLASAVAGALSSIVNNRWSTLCWSAYSYLFGERLSFLQNLLKEHPRLLECEFDVTSLVLSGLDRPEKFRPGKVSEMQRLLRRLLVTFASDEITEEMLKEPAPATA